MKIGVVSCAIMREEMEKAIQNNPYVAKVLYVSAGKHVRPKELRQSVREAIDSIKDDVDVVMLGYGECRSLKGIEDEFSIPIIHPDAEDCIAILFTPQRYHEELEKAPGTWFMTPGWAELGPDMILNELGLSQRAIDSKIDKDSLIAELFSGYKRGLYIDTGVEDSVRFEAMAEKSCGLFNLTLEKAVSRSTILVDSLKEAETMAGKVCAEPVGTNGEKKENIGSDEKKTGK